jgi:hypothetical protein
MPLALVGATARPRDHSHGHRDHITQLWRQFWGGETTRLEAWDDEQRNSSRTTSVAGWPSARTRGHEVLDRSIAPPPSQARSLCPADGLSTAIRSADHRQFASIRGDRADRRDPFLSERVMP